MDPATEAIDPILLQAGIAAEFRFSTMARRISQDPKFTWPWVDREFSEILMGCGCRTTATHKYERGFFEASSHTHRLETVLRIWEEPERFADKVLTLKINFYRKEERQPFYTFTVLFSNTSGNIYAIEGEGNLTDIR